MAIDAGGAWAPLTIDGATARTMSAVAHTMRKVNVTESRSHPGKEKSCRGLNMIDSPATDPILHVYLQFTTAFDEDLPQV